jgi:hypothetical protein
LTPSGDRPLEFRVDDAHVAEFQLVGRFFGVKTPAGEESLMDGRLLLAESFDRRSQMAGGQKPRQSERTRLTESTSAPKTLAYG